MTHSYINPIWPPITQLQFLHLPSQASDRNLTMTAHDTNVHKEIQGIFPTDSLVYHWIQTIAMAQSGNTEKYSGQWSCFIFYISLACFCSRCLCQTMSNPAFLPSRPQGATATGALKLHRAGRLHRFEATGVETLRAISGAGSGFRPLQLWLLGDLGHPQVPMPWNFPHFPTCKWSFGNNSASKYHKHLWFQGQQFQGLDHFLFDRYNCPYIRWVQRFAWNQSELSFGLTIYLCWTPKSCWSQLISTPVFSWSTSTMKPNFLSIESQKKKENDEQNWTTLRFSPVPRSGRATWSRSPGLSWCGWPLARCHRRTWSRVSRASRGRGLGGFTCFTQTNPLMFIMVMDGDNHHHNRLIIIIITFSYNP